MSTAMTLTDKRLYFQSNHCMVDNKLMYTKAQKIIDVDEITGVSFRTAHYILFLVLSILSYIPPILLKNEYEGFWYFRAGENRRIRW